jgi:hypothetical protein
MSFYKADTNFSVAGSKIEPTHFAGQFALALEYQPFLELHQDSRAFAGQMFVDKFLVAFNKAGFESFERVSRSFIKTPKSNPGGNEYGFSHKITTSSVSLVHFAFKS